MVVAPGTKHSLESVATRRRAALRGLPPSAFSRSWRKVPRRAGRPVHARRVPRNYVARAGRHAFLSAIGRRVMSFPPRPVQARWSRLWALVTLP